MYRKLVWTLVKCEMLKAVIEPKNKECKFAVAIMKDDFLVRNLSKEETGRFAKIIFYFLRACDTNTSSVVLQMRSSDQSSNIFFFFL